MGWTRFLLLGDWGQQLDLQDQDARISRLARDKRRGDQEQDARIDELEREILQLNAGVAALVTLMRDKRIASETEIAEALAGARRAAEESVADRQQRVAAAAKEAAKEAAARKLERVRRGR